MGDADAEFDASDIERRAADVKQSRLGADSISQATVGVGMVVSGDWRSVPMGQWEKVHSMFALAHGRFVCESALRSEWDLQSWCIQPESLAEAQ